MLFADGWCIAWWFRHTESALSLFRRVLIPTVISDTIYVAAGTFEITGQHGLRVEGRSLTIIGETADDGSPATIPDGFLVFMGTSGVEVSLTDTTVCGNMTPGQIIGPFTDNGGNIVAIECPPDCPADLDGDGTVGGADLTVLLGT